MQLHSAIEAGTYPPSIPWATEKRPNKSVPDISSSGESPFSCAAAIHSLETVFWQSRPRNSAAERTWKRIALKLRRLPGAAPCTLQLLIATINMQTTPGSRSRLECYKAYKQLKCS